MDVYQRQQTERLRAMLQKRYERLEWLQRTIAHAIQLHGPDLGLLTKGKMVDRALFSTWCDLQDLPPPPLPERIQAEIERYDQPLPF